jgi:hypothetical protein
MNPYALAFWLPFYLVLGSLAYIADLRWGVGARGWFIDLVSKEPGVHTQGFLVGRGKKVQYFWACVIACVTAALMVVTGVGPWLWESLIAALGSVACLLGIALGPGVVVSLRGLGIVLERMEKLEHAIKEQGPQMVQKVIDSVKPDPDAPPPPSEEELRQDKIDKMDELLGKKRERERE